MFINIVNNVMYLVLNPVFGLFSASRMTVARRIEDSGIVWTSKWAGRTTFDRRI